MALRRGHKSNGAMAVFVVVPLHQIGHPLPGNRQVGKRFQRVLRAIFQGFEQRFRIRVVVAHGRAAKRRDDAEPLQGREHGSPLHRTAVVGMQDDLPRPQAFALNNILHQFAGPLAAFFLKYLPTHNLTAKDIEEQVEIVKLAFDRRRQIGNIPTINLVRRGSSQRAGFAARLTGAFATAVFSCWAAFRMR